MIKKCCEPWMEEFMKVSVEHEDLKKEMRKLKSDMHCVTDLFELEYLLRDYPEEED